MKKIFIICVFICALFAFYKCSPELKEDNAISSEQNPKSIEGFYVKVIKTESNFKVMQYGNSSVNGRRDPVIILEFPDVDTFEALAEQLEDQSEVWDDAFVQQWANLTDDQLDAKEVQLNFDSEKPITDFENANGLTNSLRRKFLAEEEIWLNNDILDENANPNDKLQYGFDESMMALMNELGEIKINQNIYKVVKDGYLNISDGSLEKLDRYNNGDLTVLNDAAVSIDATIEIDNSNNTENFGGGCVRKAKTHTNPYATNRRAEVKIAFRSYPFKAVSRSRMTSLKKENGRWKKHRRDLQVGSTGKIYKNDCSFLNNFDAGFKSKRKKKLVQRYESWGAFPDRQTKDNELAGKYIIGGQYFTLNLN